jgi:broad specificity polyphosphatase/5'/3'-nucleotidase SurE
VSQAVNGFGAEGQGWDDALKGQQWDSAATVAQRVVEGWIADRPAEPVVINVNVPNCAVSDMKGWRRTDIGHIVPVSMATAELEAKEGHDGAFYVRMNYGNMVQMPGDTDGGAVENGEVAITYIGRFNDVPSQGSVAMNSALTDLVGEANPLHS